MHLSIVHLTFIYSPSLFFSDSMPPASTVSIHISRTCIRALLPFPLHLLSVRAMPPPPLLRRKTTTTRDVLLLLLRNHCHYHQHRNHHYHFPSFLPLLSFSRRPRASIVTRARWWKSQRNFSAAAASSWRGIIQIRSRARAAYATLRDTIRHDEARRDETRRDKTRHAVPSVDTRASVLDQLRRDSPARASVSRTANELASRVRARGTLLLPALLLWLHLVINREQCGVSS